MKSIFKILLIMGISVLSLLACEKDEPIVEELPPPEPPSGSIDYSDIPQSNIYEVTVIHEDGSDKKLVFQNACPEFQYGKDGMLEKDKYPLDIFAGRTINWTKFSFTGSITVEVEVLDQSKVPVAGSIKILPSRHNINPEVSGNKIRFTLNQPGQYSVEIGENGYKNGLMVFADPSETEVPDKASGDYKVYSHNPENSSLMISTSRTGIYFEKGIYDIGVYRVPPNIKNIYLEEGAWVYGALIMDGNPNVKIFGRGVLSGARLDYRESHAIEGVNQSDNIHIEGVVIADFKHFAVRLIGRNNTVSWTKVIGGWVYNLDGIAAFAGSNVSNCFIWANDDAIKVYRDDITVTDCVVWQLNNGGVIQMGWTAPNSSNVTISRIDVLRAEWNKFRFNVGLLNYVGNRYNEPGKTGYHSNWLIEDVVTETPVPLVFNIDPDEFSTNPIHGLHLKNWDVKMTMGTKFQNTIKGNDPNEYFDGFVFDNVVFNQVKLDVDNWVDVTDMATKNLSTPEFN